MEMRVVGNSGLEISRLGLGTMTWGRDTDTHEAADQARVYMEAGGNFLDSASHYGAGDSERVIGGLIGTLFRREDVVISTKAGITYEGGDLKTDTSRTSLMSSLDQSLSRLGTDHVDLWQVQIWDEKVPLEDSLSALDWAYTTGRARYVGVSNFNGWQSARAISLQEANSAKAPIISLQNEFSLLSRGIEVDALDCAVNLQRGFIAWSPLGRGALTGKYRSGIPADSRAATPHFAPFIEPYLNEKSRRIVEAVSVAAQGLGYAPLEVALAWVRDFPGVTSAVVGARTGAQMRGILTSEEIVLPDVVRAALDEVSL
ncbi:aldo/keto reductase [Actinobacteria bacterium IMCC26103]|nr:aldo/keto reductase [Actinobacteria bacterium IMCC26103]